MDREILISITSFFFGIFFSSFVFVSPLVSLFLILLVLAILLAEKVWHDEVSREVSLLCLVVLFFAFGSLRFAIKDFHEVVQPMPEGVVVSDPEQRDNATRFILRSDNGEKVLVSTGIYENVSYGDRVRVSAKFERPEKFSDFDYPEYLAKDDIYWQANFSKLEVISQGEVGSVRSALLKLKKSISEKMKEILPEPQASLLSGLLLAGKDAMPKDTLEEFRRAGIIHIVVLSGYNITIIAEFLRKFFEKIFLLSQKTALPWLASGASITGIIFFVLMTGGEATVVRAAIMVLTVILAKMLGRKYSAPRALLLAAFLMLLENPKILVFDPSFQLSFLATLALIYVVPQVEKMLKFVPSKFDLRTVIATTLGTQITVLPLLVYSTGDISLVSLPTNVLVLLTIPYTMLLGFIATMIAFGSSFISLPLAYVTHLLLSWILFVSNFFGNLKFSAVEINMPGWGMFILYALLGTLVVFLRKKLSLKLLFQNFLRKTAN